MTYFGKIEKKIIKSSQKFCHFKELLHLFKKSQFALQKMSHLVTLVEKRDFPVSKKKKPPKFSSFVIR